MRMNTVSPRGAAGPMGVVLGSMLACVAPNGRPQTHHAGTATRAALPSSFELLCWNVHKQRQRGFAEELRSFSRGAELVLLQEGVSVEPAWELTAAPRRWTLVEAFAYRRSRVGTGVATASGAAVLKEQALLSPGREPFSRTPKSTLLTWVAVEGSPEALLIANLHGLNFRPARQLAEQLATLDVAFAGHRGPLLVAGDFNTWTPARRRVVELFAQRHGLRPAFTGRGAPRLDAVYLRGLELRGAEVLDSRSSDHDALFVELAASRG